jgi:hypothetical protein
MQVAAKIPAVADRLQRAQQKVIDFCRSNEFSVTKLSEFVKNLG